MSFVCDERRSTASYKKLMPLYQSGFLDDENRNESIDAIQEINEDIDADNIEGL